MRSAPLPGSRSREWLQRARSNDFEFVNPNRYLPLIPGRRLETSTDPYAVRERMLGMERTLAKKWER